MSMIWPSAVTILTGGDTEVASRKSEREVSRGG